MGRLTRPALTTTVAHGVKRATGWPGKAWRALDAAAGWVPITPLGVLIAVVLWAVSRLNRGERTDLIVATVAIGGLLVCLADAPLVLAAAIWLRFRGLPATGTIPAELETGVAVRTPFRLGWVSWAPLFAFELAWEEPRGFDAWFDDDLLGRTEHIRPRVRGLYDAIERRVTIRDAFGLARVRFRLRTPCALRCVPGTAGITRLPLCEQFREGDGIGNPVGQPKGDPVEIRRYVPGDPIKLVNWKMYARLGELLVRTPERPMSPFITTLAYLVAAEGDDASASIAWTAIERGLLGPEVIFMADGAPEPTGTPATALNQIVRSAKHREHGGKGLRALLARGEASGTSAVILFVSPVAGPWLDRVTSVVARNRGPFRAVIGVDTNVMPSARPATKLRRKPWLSRAQVEPNDVHLVRQRLQNAGVQVVVVNQATGQECELDQSGGQDGVRKV
jgi:hypothetical protein